MEKLKWKPWGPKRWRADMQWLIDAINTRTPLPGLGVMADEKTDGVQLSSAQTEFPGDLSKLSQNILAPGGTPSDPAGTPFVPGADGVNWPGGITVTLKVYFGENVGFPGAWGGAGHDTVHIFHPVTHVELTSYGGDFVYAQTDHWFEAYGIKIGAYRVYYNAPGPTGDFQQQINVDAVSGY